MRAALENERGTSAAIERVASGPTAALRYVKRRIGEGFDKSLDQAMNNEVTAQGVVFETDNHREGVAAFFDGCGPAFQGR